MQNIERVRITAPNHAGYVELVYYDEVLVYFSTINTNGRSKSWYLKNIPISVTDLKAFIAIYKPKGITVSFVDVEFDEFWQLYNHKINAKRCEPFWRKMSRKHRLAAYYRIYEYNLYLEKTKIAKLNPENYLKDQRYNDEAW